MKASELLQGYLRPRRVRLPMAGTIPSQYLPGISAGQKEADLEAWRAEHPGEPDPPLPPEVGLLPLEPGTRGLVMERGRAYAKEHGLEDPQEGDDLYEYGKAIHTCLLGVVDADSDPRAPEPFFDGGVKQLLGMRELGRDGILVLAEMHEEFTAEVSGQLRKIGEADYERMVEEVAGPNGFPFWCALQPGLRWSFAHTTALQLRASRPLRSGSGTGSEPTTTTKSDEQPQPQKKHPSRSKSKSRGES